jgi:hypothetical protein
MADVRISPDGQSVAIRSAYPEDAFNAYGVMHAQHGGHWAEAADVESWTVLSNE